MTEVRLLRGVSGGNVTKIRKTTEVQRENEDGFREETDSRKTLVLAASNALAQKWR